jgi:hypothetical protein
MKTLRFAVIAVLAAFTLVALANTDDFKSKPKFTKVINLTLDKAMLNPGLVTAIYAQFPEEEFEALPNTQDVYTAQIQYESNTYRITGTHIQWTRFYHLEGTGPVRFPKGPIIW